MSLSGSISNALSGMRMSSLAAELVSSNLANATNEDYAARSLSVSSRVTGGTGGVRIDGIMRRVDQSLLADWRGANSDLSHATTLASYVSRVEKVMATPDDPASLTARLAAFETALVQASARPDLTTRLDTVVSRASSLAETFNGIADTIQKARTDADGNIQDTVAQLNDKLAQIVDLNTKISVRSRVGSDTASLEDLRQGILDDLSSITPIRVLQRDHDAVAVVTKGGLVLVEGTAAEIQFNATSTVTEHMTLQNGLLSGVTVNGDDVDISRFAGGSLEALFTARDETLPQFQAELDELAVGLATKFQDASVDPSLGATDAGLFTDGGAAFDVVDQVGLSRRLAINAAADPAQSGDLRLIRDGFLAAPGPVGDATILNNMLSALTAASPIPGGIFAGQNESMLTHASAVMSHVGTTLNGIDQLTSFASAKSASITQERLRTGVDTDAELQNLMTIEKTYAANAQVLKTVDEMLDILMGL
ncbi:flagellar hook-associated protein FlgK [Primorskyibacter aestuariivivens]|uniref:flagellar hook-associated protein FlgK n=1 Tax=Primorskyibacter aestuariivivens TaxID=1888912 RepID=UPI00230049E4|nr:flagellar hook-associated protein FlgK [Primorskyibacter aestuariivivens]MDA7427663.1 flagellar hook-associated protein FlgK [Primorskyibacter aestuariivivens]